MLKRWMPKVVDPEARRELVADAVLAQIVDAGLDSVTLARVAERSGLAIGSVRHYFSDFGELMDFTFGLVLRRNAQRAERAALRDPSTIDELVERIVFLLPITAEQHVENVAYIEFLAHSRSYPAVRSTLEQARAAAEEGLRQWLRVALPRVDDAELDARTRMLSAVVDGLAFDAAIGARPLDASQVRAAVERCLRVSDPPATQPAASTATD